MSSFDRHSTRLALGLTLLASLTGCRSARYEPAGPQAMGTGYGVASNSGARNLVAEPPRFHGRSEPVPLTESDSVEGPVFPGQPDDAAPPRSRLEGPTLRGYPVEEPEDDGPAYPGVNRRTSASTRVPMKAAGSRSPDAVAASTNPLSASHKMLGDAGGRRNSQQPATRRVAAADRAAAQPALPVAADESDAEQTAEAETAVRNDAPLKRIPLPLTTRRSRTSHRPGLESFDGSETMDSSEPKRLSNPPRLLTPPSE